MNSEYYNFMNLEDCFSQGVLKGHYNGDYLKWFKNIASVSTSMFKYKNLPNELTSEIVERALFFRNKLCFYKTQTLGLVLCGFIPNGEFNLYWKPTHVNLLALNGTPIAFNVPYNDIVLVRDNTFDIPPFLTVSSWLEKIQSKEKTLDILVEISRLPTILTGDKEQVAMLKQVIKKVGNFEPFAIASKGFKDNVEQFDIHLPVNLMQLYELMDKYKDLANASIGVYSTDEKRERIVTAEIQANNDEVDFIYNERYEERKRFVEECNKRFGTNIILEESYINNRKDEIKIMAEQVKAEENSKAEAEIKVEKVKNEGGNENVE